MKPIAVAVGMLALVLRFYVGNCDEADGKLETFYSQMLAADFVGARKSIDEAIKLWPSNGRYYGWRAYLMSQNLPPQCFHGSTAALRSQDQSAIHLAIADYRTALELNNRDAIAHHNLAWLEHLSGDDLAAGEDWSAAVAIDPGNASFHVSRAMFLDENVDEAGAQAEYQVAIELSPSIIDCERYVKRRC